MAKRSNTMHITNHPDNTIESFNEGSEAAYLLHEIKEEKPYFQPIIDPKDINRVVAVKVKQSNSRIIKQEGAFLIFGIEGKKSNPSNIPPEWVMNLERSDIDFKIQNDSKEKILDELNVLGINEATLFPELENQAKHLKKYYG